MMSKLILNNIGTDTAFQTAISTLNANNDAIETALDNTLSRNGAFPNTMGSNIDMNSNRIVNLPDAASISEPITFNQAHTLGTGGTVNISNAGGNELSYWDTMYRLL